MDLTAFLPPDLDGKVRERLAAMRQQDVVRRIWAGDPFVWSGADEDRWLGWLNLPRHSRPFVIRWCDSRARSSMSGSRISS